MARLERIGAAGRFLGLVFDQGDAERPWEECSAIVIEKSRTSPGMLNINVEDYNGEEVNILVTPDELVSLGNWCITMGKGEK